MTKVKKDGFHLFSIYITLHHITHWAFVLRTYYI